jgi:hypothetical protein
MEGFTKIAFCESARAGNPDGQTFSRALVAPIFIGLTRMVSDNPFFYNGLFMLPIGITGILF